ncbi:myb-like protein X [Parasteatoda tepidariorum]|uniref:myb-like protein X n=1 Tax=Parasteatoda tepidariorum TaxID=114398 RepID=UPI0039BC9930
MCLTRITEERIRREELEKQERREELERQERREELERERQERREELERQERREELERQHQLELRKLELEANSQIQHQNRPVSGETNHKIQILQITPKFNEGKDEMSLYLINFERRAEIAQIPKDEWVPYLLSVVPPDISNMLARESPNDANNYDFVKELILKQYKLNAEELKQNFYRHFKSPEKSWRNFAQELNCYFSEWVSEAKITTFDDLKSLMVTEQMKRHVPNDMRDHFLEDWMELNSYSKLAGKLDDYESLKNSFKEKSVSYNRSNQDDSWRSLNQSDTRTEEKLTWQKNNVKENVREREFERRRQLRCYECGSYDHLRPQCPKAKTNSETVASLHVSESRFPDIMTPYTSIGVVNGVGISILRDTGATLDLIPRRFVKPEMYTGESVWIKTPIQEESFCFPLAEVELNCKLGKVVTKAAVLGDSLDKGYYLLGNKTAALLENSFEVPMISAVMTRKQEKMNERREVENKDNVQLGIVDSNEHIVTSDQTAKNDDLLTEKIRDYNFTVYFPVYFPLLFYFPIYR